ncbi:hypothetical protein [Thiorhodococcus drewsii]|uniref:hypothetical protein n=1 Tax=Thiorhodococcus drewsii TaxID=210408 RepID=UPI001111A9B7|nr:hypothetical protein [Thiorhodococcus drewsii]
MDMKNQAEIIPSDARHAYDQAMPATSYQLLRSPVGHQSMETGLTRWVKADDSRSERRAKKKSRPKRSGRLPKEEWMISRGEDYQPTKPKDLRIRNGRQKTDALRLKSTVPDAPIYSRSRRHPP